MNIEVLKREFVPKYLIGKEKFSKFLLVYAINKLMLTEKGVYNGVPPDLEYLEYYNQFIILYRREGDVTYMNIAKVFRKVAHKVHRVMIKKNMTTESDKFLYLVADNEQNV